MCWHYWQPSSSVLSSWTNRPLIEGSTGLEPASHSDHLYQQHAISPALDTILSLFINLVKPFLTDFCRPSSEHFSLSCEQAHILANGIFKTIVTSESSFRIALARQHSLAQPHRSALLTLHPTETPSPSSPAIPPSPDYSSHRHHYSVFTRLAPPLRHPYLTIPSLRSSTVLSPFGFADIWGGVPPPPGKMGYTHPYPLK